MNDNTYQKAQLFLKYFGAYRPGNFDLSINQLAEILKILNFKKNDNEIAFELLKYRDKLENQDI